MPHAPYIQNSLTFHRLTSTLSHALIKGGLTLMGRKRPTKFFPLIDFHLQPLYLLTKANNFHQHYHHRTTHKTASSLIFIFFLLPQQKKPLKNPSTSKILTVKTPTSSS